MSRIKDLLIEKIEGDDTPRSSSMEVDELRYFKERIIEMLGPYHGGARTISKLLQEMIDTRDPHKRG